MSKEAKRLFCAGIAVSALLIISILLNYTSRLESRDTIFMDVAVTDITRVSVRNQYGTYFISAEGDGYVIDDIPPFLVSYNDFVNLMSACVKIYSVYTVDENPQDPAIFGLDDPMAVVEIDYSNGETITLSVGKSEPLSENRYFSVSGGKAVYMMENARGYLFLQPKEFLIQHRITPQLAVRSPMSAVLDVTLSGGGLEAPVILEAAVLGREDVTLAAMSVGAPTHIVRGKGIYKLDQTYGAEILGSFFGLTATEIERYNVTPGEIADFGFSAPSMTVEFDMQNGRDAPIRRYSLALLKKDDAFYMTCNDNDTIYRVERPAFYDAEYHKFLVRWFLCPMLLDLNKIEIILEEEAYLFEITGDDNASLSITCNGQILDTERFRQIYRLLTSAASDGELLAEISPQGAPLLTVIYVYKNSLKKPDVMNLYAGDIRRHYVEVNGVTEIAMREAYLTRVRQALEILFVDEVPIEIQW